MTGTLSLRQLDNLVRLGAFGSILVVIGSMIAMCTPPSDLGTTKLAYAFVMVGVDVIMAAIFGGSSKLRTRILAVCVGAAFTLLPVVLGTIDMINAA